MFQDTQKQQYYEEGQRRRRALTRLGERISRVNNQERYPHFYIYAVPGLGKTHVVTESLEKAGKKNFVISGSLSDWGFGCRLAEINYRLKGEQIAIVVDDCDEIFKDTKSINMMKNVLDGHKVFKYQKDVSKNIGNLPPEARTAVQAHMSPRELGFTVPTDNMVFIFTSNEKLPTDDEVRNTKNKGTNVYQRKMHLNAIRSRCQTKDFELEDLVQWGWIADVTFNEDMGLSDIPQHVIYEALDFMYDNWSDLKTKSLRTIQMMLNEYREFPQDYAEVWETDYIL